MFNQNTRRVRFYIGYSVYESIINFYPDPSLFFCFRRHLKKTRGPLATSPTRETVQINRHICAKQWLCHNIKRKKSLSLFWELKGWFWNESSRHTKIHCAKFGWNWSWFCRRRFLIIFRVTLLFYHYMYLPLEKGVSVHFNILESSYLLYLFRYYLPLEKVRGILVNKIESPSSYLDALCHVWLKLAQLFRRRIKFEKITTTTTDKVQMIIRKASLEPSVQMN